MLSRRYRLEVVGPESTPGDNGGEKSQNGVESDVRVLAPAKVKNDRSQHEQDHPRRCQRREPHQHLHHPRNHQTHPTDSLPNPRHTPHPPPPLPPLPPPP